MFFAFASVWRHYMELQLKSLVVVHRLLLEKDRGKLRRHGLWPLWKELHALMEEAGEDVADESVTATARLLKQFDELDPTSQEFRYNERRDGSPTLESVSRIDYLSFHNGLDAVANLLEAVDDSVHQRLDFKREMQIRVRGRHASVVRAGGLLKSRPRARKRSEWQGLPLMPRGVRGRSSSARSRGRRRSNRRRFERRADDSYGFEIVVGLRKTGAGGAVCGALDWLLQATTMLTTATKMATRERIVLVRDSRIEATDCLS